MNPLTLEWVDKAEKDREVFQALLALPPGRAEDAVCFHAQQSIEKYLKGWLQEAVILFPRTHDLVELLDLIVPTRPAWDAWRADFNRISSYAVAFRYPGRSASAVEVRLSLATSDVVRTTIRIDLGLMSPPPSLSAPAAATP
jgi:HEPN domain-containing protein